MNDDPKKYNILENILQKINQKYIALPDEEVKRNNKILLFIDNIIQRIRGKSTLFDHLYQAKYYGGSYYDNLKVGKPCEYDLDCLLCLPKIIQPTVECSDRPGYVHIVLNDMGALQKNLVEAPKYVGLEKLLDGNRISAKKVKSWMEGLMTTVLSKVSKISISIDDCEHIVTVKYSKSGPAMTIKLEGVFDEKNYNIDVDLVPCFLFTDNHWPGTDYRPNPSKTRTTFFVVPKSPSDSEVDYWRLSFQEQEKDLISGCAVMKPTIRLIKKIRDRYQHKIASYFIKTVFLWELSKVDKSFWNKPLSFVFMIMLRKYSEYITDKRILYYWNEKYNLIGDLPDITTSCISNRLKNIADELDRKYLTSPYDIVIFFLSPTEVNIETFKEEVPLGKKLLKLLAKGKSTSQENLVVLDVPPPPPASNDESSVASSFEEITKDMIGDSSLNVEIVSKLEALFVEQKRFSGMLETALEKIDKCEDQIRQLREEVQMKEKERSEFQMVTSMLKRKIDELEKKTDPSGNVVDLLLAKNDTLKRTADFREE